MSDVPFSFSQYAGRLTKIEDRNGHAITVNYKTFTSGELAASPDLQWQIDTVTDPYNQTAQFTYGASQVAGRWCVSGINVYGLGAGTTGGVKTIQYSYADGQHLTGVTLADGSASTFTYGTSGIFSTVQFDNAAADEGHRQKTAYFSNNVVIDNIHDTSGANLWVTQVYNQSALTLRLLVTGTGSHSELAYAALGAPNAVDPAHPSTRVIYTGAGGLKAVRVAWAARYYQGNWTLGSVGNGAIAVSGSMESTYAGPVASSGGDHYRGTPAKIQDEQGREYSFGYDADTYMTSETYSDASKETWEYNQFKEVTRYKDRLDRVTKYYYDQSGNMTYKEVGLIRNATSGADIAQPEHAFYRWGYYTAGETPSLADASGASPGQPGGFLKRTFEPISAATYAAAHSASWPVYTQYVYNAQKLLSVVYEPNDAGGGVHAAAKQLYDGFGRLTQSIDAVGRTVQYAYDSLNRPSLVTYADASTEFYGYGTGEHSHLLVRMKDRNGVAARYRYDSQSRPTAVTQAYSTMAANGSSETPLPASLNAVTTYTYLPGTQLRTSVTRLGNATSYAYDYRQRVIATTVHPQTGVSLTSSSIYVNNDLFSQTDPYGRSTYYAYRERRRYGSKRPGHGSRLHPGQFCLCHERRANDDPQSRPSHHQLRPRRRRTGRADD